jgi:hypothetical protein
MLFYEVLIALGLLLIIGLMAFLINPPEAWIKKAVRRAGTKSDPQHNKPQ